MKRLLAFLYGLVSYALFLVVFVYAIGFVGDLMVPKTIDTVPGASIDSTASTSWAQALAVNLALLGLFALQHSGMARPAFKRRWTKIVPESIERSTYVLLASLVLALLFWQWRPMTTTVWDVEAVAGQVVLWGLFAVGWAIVLASTFMISHAHLFGLQQVHQHLRRQELAGPSFQTPGLYRHLRHPIMIGFLIAFWATPHMSVGHLLFAGATTLYILGALQLEERDLLAAFGDRYRAYRQQVPMLLPALRPRKSSAAEREAGSSV